MRLSLLEHLTVVPEKPRVNGTGLKEGILHSQRLRWVIQKHSVSYWGDSLDPTVLLRCKTLNNVLHGPAPRSNPSPAPGPRTEMLLPVRSRWCLNAKGWSAKQRQSAPATPARTLVHALVSRTGYRTSSSRPYAAACSRWVGLMARRDHFYPAFDSRTGSTTSWSHLSSSWPVWCEYLPLYPRHGFLLPGLYRVWLAALSSISGSRISWDMGRYVWRPHAGKQLTFP